MEYIKPRVNLKSDFGDCDVSHRLISFNKCTILVGMLLIGEAILEADGI
jgi:hypothetical protein